MSPCVKFRAAYIRGDITYIPYFLPTCPQLVQIQIQAVMWLQTMALDRHLQFSNARMPFLSYWHLANIQHAMSDSDPSNCFHPLFASLAYYIQMLAPSHIIGRKC